MSANDRIILDKILEQRQQEIAPQLSQSKFFELFTAEQILKDYDLSYEEIESGIVGDGGDGGVDSLYAFVNGDLIQDDTDTTGLRRNVAVDLVIIQAKIAAGFTEGAIDRLKAFTDDLLDLSKDVSELSTVYNEDVRAGIKRFRGIYQDLAARFPSLTVSFRYATKGDEPHPNVSRKVDALGVSVQRLFSSAHFDFEFLGASALLDLARRAPRNSYALELAENPISSSGSVAFICLVSLQNFFAFITDENRTLIKSLFESNVRDYQGATQVNDEIQITLKDNKEDEFWWLNNGITVICTKATLSGKTLTIEDPQIVNGLQTSSEVYKYFREHNTLDERRNLLVRVIVPPATESRDRIIKATNSQTQIPIASLRATERIHRDIEEYLRPHGLFYDRRKNYYKNEGRPIENIVSIPSLAQAVMAIALQRPNDARARPSSLLKKEADYDTVFTPNYPISLYLACARLMKVVDAGIRNAKYALNREEMTNLRFYIATYLASLATSKASPSPKDIAATSGVSINDKMLDEAVFEVSGEYNRLGPTDQVAKGTDLIASIKLMLESKFLRAH